jgi:hypothetical protein
MNKDVLSNMLAVRRSDKPKPGLVIEPFNGTDRTNAGHFISYIEDILLCIFAIN